jgi:hypothetical protein
LGLAGSADILNLYAARAARGFGDGFAAIILPAYLLEMLRSRFRPRKNLPRLRHSLPPHLR